VGFSGQFAFDASRPDGTPRKLLDVSKLTVLGWRPRISLAAGIRDTYELYRASRTA
jgi:GDP-L-fucose synthase